MYAEPWLMFKHCIGSCRKKMCSLEKERQDMLQTIDALQEEKKLLQSKLRKTSAGGMSVDINQGHAKKDASTCTNDLGLDIGAADGDSSGGMSSDLQGHDNADNLLLLAMHRPAGGLDSATAIPPDQAQMIQNINSLISEIMEEKEELVQALMAERMASTKLKDLNKELSQKLEVQTQRLELLTSQSMASENIPARQPIGPRIARETGVYADEGDEPTKAGKTSFPDFFGGSFRNQPLGNNVAYVWIELPTPYPSESLVGGGGGGESLRMDNEAVSRRTIQEKNKQALNPQCLQLTQMEASYSSVSSKVKF
ncbi:hypothetical protein Cgig2_018478 [Carnegiea gigantea]|uniref:Uncharacterized protein n=1 Tax=Carnegiea gigantea TaxID=171969 RepID=A0A9Q1Q493_9CARY|nr:hypothetical protein Cgig2_018478 [Carnegiea gigantea]